MIKYFVRTTNERKLDRTYNQVDYKRLVDLEHKPVKSFIEQLKAINDYDSVLLEDDLILCKDFKKEIEKVIKEHPDCIINFFTTPLQYFKTKKDYHFCYNQCTYYPKGEALRIAIEMERILNEDIKYKNCNQYDILENRALINLNKSHVKYRPCLVQHIDNNSLMGNKVNRLRKTPFFIDYLKELNIDYNNANKQENRCKLMDLMIK